MSSLMMQLRYVIFIIVVIMSTSSLCVLAVSGDSILESETETLTAEDSSGSCNPDTEPSCKNEKPAPPLPTELNPGQSDQDSRLDGPPVEPGGARSVQRGAPGVGIGGAEEGRQLGTDSEVLSSQTTTLNSGSDTQSDLRQKETQIPATPPLQTPQDSLKGTGGNLQHENTEKNRQTPAGQDHPNNNGVTREDAPAAGTDDAGRPQEPQSGSHPNSSTEPITTGTNTPEKTTVQEQTSNTQESQSTNGTEDAATTTSGTPTNTNNDEESTTTTTLPPEPTNNKKGDADSSSSISSSVWVRVPLLIVVTLACILVC
ncbi:uncharacterized protein TM35_000084370 [Trypanosoma theileri]|uniref:Mucin TcMUCII n=1 Tax=Trypanosoma theileri TaxID=67003 RepID=A0A1X0P282_9TRYP|nr:uncharacterized protein TM35_000084370 [Trypanosoma theileri]ORC90639.1 hypothetical protein TM35_000084370 [Trypanosoma theileri]